MDLSLIRFALSTLIVMPGAVLQAATRLGGSLLVVPFLALIDVKLIPGPVIFVSLALSSLMAYRGRFLLGYALAGPIARWLDGRYSRIAILALSTVSSLVLIGKSL